MPELCYSITCTLPAVDEYHWYEELRIPKGVRVKGGPKIENSDQVFSVEVVWELCEDHCNLAVEMVEWISEIDNEEERKTWGPGHVTE